uniref:Uncharacterized protein n=1 Tax=Pyxicephalus adspersus TaxID=30357 RepID=A0AAV3B9H2_PYXAD|nr:TPA: hypothetical protein GDO54_001196 [Pyxicephalus adspersus]
MSAQTALPPDHDPLPPVPDSGALEPKKKKHKGGTLRRALSWLRGRKKKKPEAKQQESKENAKTDGQSQPIPAQDEESSDNAFFPSRRTALLEDIHSQAQEGLKSLQRRGKENNSTCPSNEDGEDAFRTRSLSCSTENTDDAMSVRSEMIQRKGSTFRPHDSPSWPSNKAGRRRKQKRATVVGVPQHIAAELGLHTPSLKRGIHELFFKGESQPREKEATDPTVNGVQRDGEEYVVIPTVDGVSAAAPHNGAHISLAALEQTESALQRHIEKVYQDDSCIGWKTSQKISPLLIRPKSVAVPGMTTHSPQSDPVSPVMYISPQGTYMSKIIPNAVLPPLVDVVALGRSSVRTLSRCSLASASPASIRGSLHRGRGMSTSSETWSRSQSTETIVSDSSTISSRGGENTLEGSEKQHESRLSTGRASPAPSTGTQDGSDAASLCSGRSSIRSVSLRKSKKAPPPPKRTYSLQQQREMGLPPRPEKKTSTKTSNNRDPWVPRADKATVENEVFLPNLSSPTRSDRTLSPSSGYSSQSGTPTLPVRSLVESPGTRRRTPPKPERSSLKSASGVNTSSTLAENSSLLFVSPPIADPSMGEQKEQYIPPHPNVPAPICPPPIDFLVAPVATPAPSPPPSHHPTPPPVRKSESDAEIPLLTLEEATQKESLWPPPPPEMPDEQDLSMADFPPPEEDFLPPPPSLEQVSNSVTSLTVRSNDNKEMTEAEKPLLNSKNETSSDIVKTQHDSVPSTNTKPPDTAVNSVHLGTPITFVLDSEKDNQQPALALTSEPEVRPSQTGNSGESLLPSIVYKPHCAATVSAENDEHKEQLEVSVQQNTSGDQSVCIEEPKVSTDKSTSTVSQSSVDTSASPAVTTSSAQSSAIGSPLPLSNVWKPVSSPSSRKLPTHNQGITAQPKEDASLPIVTPSLLQMVRLRSVQARGPQIPFQLPSGVPAPQKPVRKSLSIRSSQGSDSSQGESPISTQPSPSLQKPPDSPSAHRSPASAASFVFARGSKKFVFEPPVSQEAESSLKKDLVAELKSQGGPRSPDGKPPIQRKPSKIPPPVARKPSIGIPRTPTSPLNATGGANGNIVTLDDAVSAQPLSGTSVSGTLENHEQQHKSPMEQA